MRTILSIIGIGSALVMCGVSGAMNYLFLSSLGKTPLEGHVMGAASAAADILKALLPFFIAWSWQQRRVVAACAGSLAFVFFAGFSFLSAIGFAADNRGVLVETRGTITSEYERVQRETRDAESRLTGLPAHRPSAVVLEEIERHRQNRRWSATKDCAEATESQSRDFCAAYFALRAELAAAQEADRLASDIAALRVQTEHLRESGAGQDPDPQVSLLSHISGHVPEQARLALVIAVALLVEIGASLGLFLASGHGTPAKRVTKPSPPQDDTAPNLAAPRPLGSVEDFCLEALVPAEIGGLTEAEIRDQYGLWCRLTGRTSMEAPAFGEEFRALMQELRVPCKSGRWLRFGLKGDIAA